VYLGIEKDFPEQLLYHPYRKERRQTKDSYPKKKKQYNQSHSERRIVVEHNTAICRLKKFNRVIAEDIFRNRLKKYNKI
jgi:hypothetical protein